MRSAAVLIIGGEGKFYLDLERYLSMDDLVVDRIEHFQKAINNFELYQPCMVVLGCPAEGVSGLTYCQEIRTLYSGLLLLVSEQEDNNFHKLALDLGADASMGCGDGVPLIVSLIKALMRRFIPLEPELQLTFGNVAVDAQRRDVFVGGQALSLSSIEFQLFWCLAKKAGCVVSREDLHKEMYNTTYNGYDRSIDLYISRIRQKIGNFPISTIGLKTVRGVGYQFIDTNCYNHETLEL